MPSMTMQNNSIAMLLLSLLYSSTLTFAFTTRGCSSEATIKRDYIMNKQNMGSSTFVTAVHYKDVEDNDYSLDSVDIKRTRIVSNTPTDISSEDVLDLPRSYVKKMTDMGEFPSDSMSEAEMLVGRVCMIASLWLIGNEILTGIGFADQIMNGIGKL